ncbi:MAG: DNA-binding protein WhiA [Clostridiales Family XIII bacterium]|jgi:DNA-binding protein WhiA|nr:DNA-binding protein WhiA [Clostridiales Family XIII bacterium]
MSFSSEVKSEISHSLPEKECCLSAELSGFSKAAGSIHLLGKGELRLSLRTEYPVVARHIRSLAKEITGASPSVNVIEGSGVGRPGKRRVYELSVENDLVTAEGFIGGEAQDPSLMGKCCRKSYLKGLFLGAGSITDPDKAYHFELVFQTAGSAAMARRLVNSFTDLHAGICSRQGKWVVYLKAAEQIKDVLGIMDAHRQLLAFEDCRMMKSVRGEANRLSNFDNANLDRTMSAAESQLSDIHRISCGPGLDSLSVKLKEIALLRLEDNEASLSEIASMTKPEVSKAAAAARFKKLSEIASLIVDF